MAARPGFGREVSNLLYASEGSSLDACMQCGTCSGTCPAAEFMDYSPREVVALVRADLKDKVLSSNAFWSCASCYQCTVRCPRGINIAEMMYALKRYSMWKNRYRKGLIGPGFSKRFIRIVTKTGRMFEPALAPAFIFKRGIGGFFREALNGFSLFLKGKIALFPSRIKRRKNFRRVLARIIPLGGAA